MTNFVLKRSNRKTVSLQIEKDLSIVVKAPLFMSVKSIEDFVISHESWIEKNRALMKERNRIIQYSQEKLEQLKRAARGIITSKVDYYSYVMGLKPTSVKITGAKTRFGSCSGKNGLCFSYLLMLYPESAIDYVVVHELAHIVHHNHSAEFYKLIERYLPDYRQCRRLLKK